MLDFPPAVEPQGAISPYYIGIGRPSESMAPVTARSVSCQHSTKVEASTHVIEKVGWRPESRAITLLHNNRIARKVRADALA